MTLDRVPPATPRFNMPFELGLAVALSQESKHEWFVFEVLRALANALVRRRHRPSPRQLDDVYTDICRAAQAIRRDLQADTLFDARAFDDLVVASRISAQRRIPVSGR